MDDKLAVYIGAHPDDIDIGMSGSLYEFDLGKHPLMWIVVTDGGADEVEYVYDSAEDPGSGRPWLKRRDLKSIKWKAPDERELSRSRYSGDLAQKRCGIKFDNLGWTPQSASHPSSFGEEFDWRSRVANLVGRDVEIRQLIYSGQLLYPDGSLSSREEIFTRSIAENLAEEINGLINSRGYSKDLVYINSHGTDAVCKNSDEHEDHRITGNAVLKAIGILLHSGIEEICASWFTIYRPIVPRRGYSRVDVDVSGAKQEKSRLCRACWETEFLAQHEGSRLKSWGEDGSRRRYPDDPIDYEYNIEISYTNENRNILRKSERYNNSLRSRLARRLIPPRFRL